MSHFTIPGTSFALDRAELVAYHCASKTADWNNRLCLGAIAVP